MAGGLNLISCAVNVHRHVIIRVVSFMEILGRLTTQMASKVHWHAGKSVEIIRQVHGVAAVAEHYIATLTIPFLVPPPNLHMGLYQDLREYRGRFSKEGFLSQPAALLQAFQQNCAFLSGLAPCLFGNLQEFVRIGTRPPLVLPGGSFFTRCNNRHYAMQDKGISLYVAYVLNRCIIGWAQ